MNALEVPPCPSDTDGDGTCMNAWCNWCGLGGQMAETRLLLWLLEQPERSAGLRQIQETLWPHLAVFQVRLFTDALCWDCARTSDRSPELPLRNLVVLGMAGYSLRPGFDVCTSTWRTMRCMHPPHLLGRHQHEHKPQEAYRRTVVHTWPSVTDRRLTEVSRG